ncbi:MAG: transglycosylase SLT domain-containing protein [Alcanivoracaceae bacterium]
MFAPMMRRCLVLCAALLPGISAATADDRARQFGLALEAARQSQWAQLDRHQKALGDDVALQGYLDFHRLRARLHSASLEEVLGYLRKYDDSPLADSMRRVAMDHYGQRKQWASLQAVSAGVPGPLALRCYYYQAMLAEERERALEDAHQLWLSGQTRPTACDPLFDALKASGELSDELLWQRFLLAARSNNDGLMRFLRSELRDPAWRARTDSVFRYLQHPEQIRHLDVGAHHGDIVAVILDRLAERQPEEARRVLPMLAKRHELSEPQQLQISERIAWFSTIRDLPENRAWLDQYLAEHGELRTLEQRARRAVIEQDWDGLERWVNRLPARDRTSPRWRYWLARAYEARDNDEMAQRYYRLAASGRSFWGFLAADRLGLPPALNLRPALEEDITLSERAERVLTRVDMLLAIGEAGHAREEWLFLLRHLDDSSQQDALARIAIERGWPHLAIETALHTGRHDVLDWRFPLAQQQAFEAASAKYGVDSWLLMAIARRESAFNPQARSHAGAMGLMQLMPGTARDMARQAGVALRNNDSVFDPAVNIELGSRYMARMMQRYGGNRVLALAAYNAGPHRVDRWLDESHTPYDVFIESIPFHETREYVQAVLAYRVILSRHQPDQPLLALLNERETARPYTPMQLAANQAR